MSIRREWVGHVEAKRLYKINPFPGDRDARTVLVSEEINALISGPWDEQEAGVRCGKLLAKLQRIVRGETLVVCMEPFAARNAAMGRLDPIDDSIFDIRDRDEPGLRVFCRFAERDVLVASVCAPRSKRVSWLPRPPLGERYSREWRWGKTECKSHWTQHFPIHDPIKGDNLNDYLSGAIPE